MNNLPTSNQKNASVGLEFNLPLFQGGGTDSHVRWAVANLDRARFELDHARRQALVSNEAQLRSTKLDLEVGVRTRVDVLNAEPQRYATLRDLYAARYQVLVAGLQLKVAAGILSEEDLKGIDALLKSSRPPSPPCCRPGAP